MDTALQARVKAVEDDYLKAADKNELAKAIEDEAKRADAAEKANAAAAQAASQAAAQALVDAKAHADNAVKALNVTDAAVAGQYVSAVNEVEGKIVISRADLPVDTLTSGSANGTVSFNGADVAVTGLKSAAYAEASAFDASGSAQAAKEAVIGTSADASSANTVYGAKAYTDEALTWYEG